MAVEKNLRHIFSHSHLCLSLYYFLFLIFLFYSNRLTDLLSILILAVCSLDNTERMRMGGVGEEGANDSR